MATMTDGAARILRAAIDRTEQEGAALRLVKASPGWELQVGFPEEGDAVVEHEGETILVMAGEVAGELSDVAIDVQDSGDGPRLVLTKT